MLLNQLRLHLMTGNFLYLQRSEQLLSLYGASMLHNAYGYASFLNALHFYLYPAEEIVIVSPDKEKTGALLNAVFSTYLPNKIIILKCGPKGQSPALAPALVPDSA